MTDYKPNRFMKKLHILPMIIALLLLSSCDDSFLVKTPSDALPEDGFYNSPERAVAAVNAAYATLQHGDLYRNTYAKLAEAPSDDVQLSNTSGTEFNTFAHASSSALLMEVYSRLYEGVYRSNKALEEVPGIDMDANLKSRLIAEAKFLRALYYWHLTTLWGDVPLFTETFETPEDALVAKSPKSDIYDVMIQDLLDAEADLPPTYDAGDVGRATKGAARSLLGKVYLYDENYEQAEVWLDRVIDSELYELVDDFETIIHEEYENDSESIFEVQFLQVGSGDVQTLRVQYNLPQGQGGVGNHLPNQDIVDAFEPNDPRLGYSIFQDGDPFAPHLDDPSYHTYSSVNSATGFNLKKGLVPIKLSNNGGVNFPIIRYADVLLMYAEAANELDMRDEARDALNEVRQRPSVNMPDRTIAETDTKEEMFDAIVHERRVELAFEYHRFNDLKRWGLAEQELGANGYSERHRYFPLPQEERDANPLLDQWELW